VHKSAFKIGISAFKCVKIIRHIYSCTCIISVSHMAIFKTELLMVKKDHFCGPVVRVYGYRSRGSGFDSRRFQIF
jgi:hypothetical protein